VANPSALEMFLQNEIMTVAEVYKRIKTRSEIARYFCSTTGTYIENPWKLFTPADKDLIIAFEKKGFSLPEGIRTLLLLTNGIEYQCAEQHLFSIEDMIALADVFKGTHKPGISPLVISGRIGDTFGYGFPLFLERLMYCEFNNFW
jgi:hypothetical protein